MKLIFSKLEKYEDKLRIFDEDKIEVDVKIEESNDIAKIAVEHLWMDILAEEYVYLLALKANFDVCRVFLISKGGFGESYVNVSSIFASVLMCGCERFILVHNHPSGNPEPSEDDDKLTVKTLKASKLMDLTFLDHVIIGFDKFYSYCRSTDLFTSGGNDIYGDRV